MMKIPGYQTGKQIYKCKNYLIFQGFRKTDDQSVLLKIPNLDDPSPRVSELYQHEFAILQSLKGDGIVRALDLVKSDDGPVLVYEDIGGELLSNLSVNRTFSMAERLAIAVEITGAIDQVHRAGFIHRRVNPANILYHPKTSRAQLINFEMATELIAGQIYSNNAEATLQTMAYLAPEQTGKMNRALEYQSDLYSLGATLYELFCGKRVFESNSLIELIHSHIAVIPTSPSQVNPLVPASLSNIIMKLLSKEAQDRYRCAAGLKHDLRWCRDQYKKRGHIGPFSLQQHDMSEQFRMSSKIYGRDDEIDILMQAFARARKGGLEQVLVTGGPGIGKTALVNEVLQRIAAINAEVTVYLGFGKFDQFHRDIPYSAIVQGLKDVIRQILSESDEALEKWRQKLGSALGRNGCVIADIIPEIEFILGPQPAIPSLGPLEAQNRLNLVFQNFIRALSGPSHPLIFFIDDIQWADTSSIQLIETMLADDGLDYFLGISTCRDEELASGHPIHIVLDSLKNKKVRITQLQLGSLGLEAVTSLIADSFGTDIYHASDLGALTLQKTDGNPFFVEMFLKTLRSENLLSFDSNRAQWQWSIPRINQLEITDNVVDLVVQKIQGLSEKTRNLLEWASCIGVEFDLTEISTISKLPSAEIGLMLREAVTEGILMPLNTFFHHAKNSEPPEQIYTPGRYRFAHDRIQQTIYASMAPDKKPHCHAHIGLSLFQNSSDSQKKDRLFTITNHLNLGGDQSLLVLDRDTLCRLNLDAGINARTSVAFHPAYNYFKHGIQILGKDGWKDNYDITKLLYEKATEAAYLCGYYDEMDRLANVVLESARSLLEKTNTYETIINSYIARYQIDQATSIAIGVARDLNVQLSDKTSKWRLLRSYLATKSCLAWKNIEDLAHIKKMSNPTKLAAMQILNSVGSAAYFSNQDLLAVSTFEGVRLSSKYGNAPESAILYAVYGLILCGFMGDIDSGYQFGELSLNLIKKDNLHELASQAGQLVNSFVNHWKIHIRETLSPLKDAYKKGLECGDFEYGGYSAAFFCVHSFIAGVDLSEVESLMAKYGKAVGRLKHEFTFIYLNVYRQLIANLLGENSDPLLLSGPYYKEDEQLRAHKEANDKTTLSTIYLNKLYLNFLFGNYKKASYYASLTEEYLGGMMGMFNTALFYFYDSLTRLALYPEMKAYDKNKTINQVAANQKKLRRWAQHAPMNHQHRYDLVKAERLAVTGQQIDAEKYYHKALELSQRYGYQNDEALILERTAIFYADRGENQLAADTMLEARAAFEKWGAVAKVRAIDKEFSFLIVDRHANGQIKEPAAAVNSDKGLSLIEKDLDMAAIMEANRAISREIVLDKLLGQLMRIIIENAGAERGYLILKKEGELWIEATAMANSDEIKAHHSIPLEKSEGLPTNIIRYVEHTKEPMVIQNVNENDQFFSTQSAIESRPKSVLCMPLLQKERVIGVLYLENKLASHVFTKERIKVMNILLAQAAISLENALLYENLKKEVSFRIKAEKKSLHLATAMEQTAEGIMTVDLDNIISYANPGCEEIYGYKPEELIGQKTDIFHSGKEDQTFFDTLDRTIYSGNTWSGHMTNRRKDGTIRELELTISPIKDEKGKITSFVSVSRDMTHEIQMEKELRQAQKLEAMGTLAGGIAHDFNNILAAIMGYTELASLQAPPETSIHQNLERVIASTKRAKDLVRQILAFSRQTDHEVRPIQLYTLLKEALKMLRASLPSTIEFRQEIEESGYVEADPTQIHQVIMNLCTNAAQAMNKGGVLTVSLGDYTVDKNNFHRYPEVMPGSFLELSVSDTGEGIEQEIIERIYEPFFTTKPPGKGTGMGLAMVHGIVKSYGGAIRVKSKVGEGTEFRVLLPKYKGNLTASEEEDSREALPGKERIMFVDDEKALVNLAEEGLQRIGYSVHIETDSQEALKIFKQNPDQFDLVITDQTMPKLTGTELSKELLKVRPDIPIILYSGLMEELPKEKIELTGIRTFLSKPLLIKQLSESIREILDEPAEVVMG